LTGHRVSADDENKSDGGRRRERRPRRDNAAKRDPSFELQRATNRLNLREKGLWVFDGERTGGANVGGDALGPLITRYSSDIPASMVAAMDSDEIDNDLVVKILKYIDTHLGPGAVLVFLPGWAEIQALHDLLTHASSHFGDKNRFTVYPLHSSMPTTNQREIFDRPPKGVRKIILSTNIAETSITIDDVVFVVDSGFSKEKIYDPHTDVACFGASRISKANSRQRRGRAGRVQAGICFHLFSTNTLDEMSEQQLPELQRTPLEQVCLQIKALGLGMAQRFLARAPSPPSPQAVANALALLTEIGALSPDEELTELGRYLADLPVHPALGKMLLYAVLFRCVDPAIAATLAHRAPFVLPLHDKSAADQSKLNFAGGFSSDHIAHLNAYESWRSEGRRFESYARQHYLSQSTLKMIDGMREQFAKLLNEAGLMQFSRAGRPDVSQLNANSDSWPLILGLLVVGLYPNVARIDPKRKRVSMFTQSDGTVKPHPGSVQDPTSQYLHRWLVFHEKVRSTNLFLMEMSVVSPSALCLFGGNLFYEDGRMYVAKDWVCFEATGQVAEEIQNLRALLDTQVALALKDPSVNCAKFPSARLISTVCRVLEEGETTGFAATGGIGERNGKVVEGSDDDGSSSDSADARSAPNNSVREPRNLESLRSDVTGQPHRIGTFEPRKHFRAQRGWNDEGRHGGLGRAPSRGSRGGSRSNNAGF